MPRDTEIRNARSCARWLFKDRCQMPTGVLDCLQLSDKMQILIKDTAQHAGMGFDSRRTARHVAWKNQSRLAPA
jgi:hypothetical protein